MRACAYKGGGAQTIGVADTKDMLYTTGMKIFLDTAKIDEIESALALGVVDGVTTNPTHVAAAGIAVSELYPQICKMVPGPVSLEAIALETDAIIAEGRALAKIADNVVVKVPVTREGLAAVKALGAEGIRTNVTTVFSATQALLVAKCGATFVSPFVGRLDAIGNIGMSLAEEIRQIYDNYEFATELLVAAVRHPEHVLRAALIGADICTMNLAVLQQLYDHPLTDAGIEQFLKDWSKVPV